MSNTENTTELRAAEDARTMWSCTDCGCEFTETEDCNIGGCPECAGGNLSEIENTETTAASFTPGPWEAGKINQATPHAGTIPIRTAQSDNRSLFAAKYIATVCGTSTTQVSTARLIAAAPEMFALLERLRGELDGDDIEALRDDALALLAKIRSRSSGRPADGR